MSLKKTGLKVTFPDTLPTYRKMDKQTPPEPNNWLVFGLEVGTDLFWRLLDVR